LARRLAATGPPGKLQELVASSDTYLPAGIVLAVFGSMVGLQGGQIVSTGSADAGTTLAVSVATQRDFRAPPGCPADQGRD